MASRYDNAYQDDLHPHIDQELNLDTSDPSAYDDQFATPVRVVDDGNVPEHKVQQGSYQTVIIPASTSTVAGWAQILPADPLRGFAYVMPIDYPIVIATTQSEVQSVNNIGAAFPNGGYIGTGFSPPIRHKEALYASNTSTAGTNRVVVMIERGQA